MEKSKILIVEDEAIIAMEIENSLQKLHSLFINLTL